jgi:predicted SPOUT superfamily RNA methylase MTH1
VSVRSQKADSLKRNYELSIAIPGSLIGDVPHLREKTFRVGLIGRAAAIFRVDEIIVFPDLPHTDQSWDINLVTILLSYMETPQYLRKKLFKIRPELKYAGALPPLRTPHHPLSDRTESLKMGEHREGVVTSVVKGGSLVDIGVERPVFVSKPRLPLNDRVTVRVTGLGKQPKAVLTDRDKIKNYWGYRVTVSDIPFAQLLKNRSFDLVIATSRRGRPLKEVMGNLGKQWKRSDKIFVAFGAPTQGLHEITARERVSLDEIAHFVINTIPDQGTETVRTEEALYASLAVLNLLDGV